MEAAASFRQEHPQLILGMGDDYGAELIAAPVLGEPEKGVATT